MVNSLNGESETLIEIGKQYQKQTEQISKKINEEKDMYESDYTAEGILLNRIHDRFRYWKGIDFIWNSCNNDICCKYNWRKNIE